MTQRSTDEVRTIVREHYGNVAKANGCGSGCCGPNPEAALQIGYAPEDLASVPEGANMGLGCGNPQAIASLRTGESVLDLGSGGGFDCFLAGRQVGPSGHVIGVDMTAEMVSKARANAKRIDAQNVEFRMGEIEHLPVADATVDVIVSNCVINLSPDKPAVLSEAFRVLRPGGRLAIADIVATSPMPTELAEKVAALTGCIAGAILQSEFESMLRAVGFENVRVTVNEDSRNFIRDWMPDLDAGLYVASASIEANKPGNDLRGHLATNSNGATA